MTKKKQISENPFMLRHKPIIPRKVSESSLNKLSIKQLQNKQKKLQIKQTRLWDWGFRHNQLGSKAYVNTIVRIRMILNDTHRVMMNKIVKKRNRR